MTLPTPASDRLALVTGGSAGIGAEIAAQLVQRGHRVALVARSVDKLEAKAAELRAAGGTVDVLPTDLADRASRATLPDRIAELGAVVDILVNNAGSATTGPVHRSDAEAEMAMVELDVMAVVDLCSRFVPGMVERGRGAVMNVASTGAFQPVPGQAGYGAGKAFVLSYTYGLSGELRGTGVNATTLCPGPVETGFGDRAGLPTEEAKKSLPAAMWLEPGEVARVGLEALDKGRLVAIPGMANRAGALFGRYAPRSAILGMLAKSHPTLREG